MKNHIPQWNAMPDWERVYPSVSDQLKNVTRLSDRKSAMTFENIKGEKLYPKRRKNNHKSFSRTHFGDEMKKQLEALTSNPKFRLERMSQWN